MGCGLIVNNWPLGPLTIIRQIAVKGNPGIVNGSRQATGDHCVSDSWVGGALKFKGIGQRVAELFFETMEFVESPLCNLLSAVVGDHWNASTKRMVLAAVVPVKRS
jgi:hypothetical protein